MEPLTDGEIYGNEYHREPPTAPVSEGERQRHHRLIEHLHRLGPRPVGEALLEVAGGADVDQTLRRYGELDPEIVMAVGADRFPVPPIGEVR